VLLSRDWKGMDPDMDGQPKARQRGRKRAALAKPRIAVRVRSPFGQLEFRSEKEFLAFRRRYANTTIHDQWLGKGCSVEYRW